MLRRRYCGSALGAVAVFITGVLIAQAPVHQLDWYPGIRIERQMPGSGMDAFSIPLSAQQFVRLEIVQKGSDLAISLLDPEGRSLIAADSANGRYGPETLVAIAPSAGTYRVQV